MKPMTRTLALAAAGAALLLGSIARPTSAQGEPRTPTASRTQPLFGSGPEIYLHPSYGPVGTRVQAVGLGFAPGQRVRLRFGAPNGDFHAPPFATAVAGRDGRVQTSFRISAAMRNASPVYTQNPGAFTQFGLLIQANTSPQMATLVVTFAR